MSVRGGVYECPRPASSAGSGSGSGSGSVSGSSFLPGRQVSQPWEDRATTQGSSSHSSRDSADESIRGNRLETNQNSIERSVRLGQEQEMRDDSIECAELDDLANSEYILTRF